MFSFHFETKKTTNYGDSLYVVGNHVLFGNWDYNKGLEVKTNKYIYPTWKSEYFETDKYNDIINLEYKYVLVTKDKNVYWEIGNNRKLINFLKISNWEFDDKLKNRFTQDIYFMTSSKTIISSIFCELYKLNKIYISIRGDMKYSHCADIIDKDFIKKYIILKLKHNYIKKNKLQTINMPYYRISFNKETPIIEGPFEYYNL